ncbi:radical SAM/SPASM domain-containing protein [Bacteroidia bacterium]|nr:radical SAM/SPASM domain-containing protein [Bacteroidia bacterium]GHU87323.1 radical SAM/SPASM domain-containing protein [Bacteroidia bacterium]
MKNQVSRYNIEVEHTDNMLLYNALTDKLLPVGFKDYAIIETLMENLDAFSEKFPDLYAAFRKSGFIVAPDFDELAYIKLQNKRKVYANNNYRITINPTLDCNLRCWYCSVTCAGADHYKERMSSETVESINNHIRYLVENRKAGSILLDWFGGEPMMYYDEVIRKISDFAKKIVEEHQIFFQQQMTTNATLFNEKRIREMADSKFNFFQIPIDGNERHHNLIKRYPDKSGSYRDVVNNVNMISEMIPNVFITLRVNYDKQTLKNIKDIVNDFSETAKKHISVDFQRVWQIKCTDKERELLKKNKEEFKAEGFNSSFWAYKPLMFHRCYADNYNYYVIHYNGKIFKCTARDYGNESVIGNLQNDGRIIWNEGLLSKHYEKAGFENERCESCKMLPLCMGPCIQKNYEVRVKNAAFRCMYDNVEYSLSNYVIDLAKQRNLI